MFAFAISSVMLTVTGVPSNTVTLRTSLRKRSCSTISVYWLGERKKKRYTPSRSVLVDSVVPLLMSLISTFAFGTTAPL